MNYGLKLGGRKEKDYIFGTLENDIINENGDWSRYLPDYEPQILKDGTDEHGCYIWGTQNALETYLNYITSKKWNLSERHVFNGMNAEPLGGDPFEAGEFMRRNGFLLENDLPIPDTYQEFIKPRPLSKELINKALKNKESFPISQEYVWSDRLPLETKQYLITQALKRSPLGISVYAWEKDNDGLYYKPIGQRDCHWCVLYSESELWYNVFDSYDQSTKRVRRDTDFEIAIRYKVDQNYSLCNFFKYKYGL